MGRPYTYLFQVNGSPLLNPDPDVMVRYQDQESDATGMDETGVTHRFPLRYNVPEWTFSYAALTDEEKNYLESLFPEAPNFDFTHPTRTNADTTTVSKCYVDKREMSWFNPRSRVWRNYGFTIRMC